MHVCKILTRETFQNTKKNKVETVYKLLWSINANELDKMDTDTSDAKQVWNYA